MSHDPHWATSVPKILRPKKCSFQMQKHNPKIKGLFQPKTGFLNSSGISTGEPHKDTHLKLLAGRTNLRGSIIDCYTYALFPTLWIIYLPKVPFPFFTLFILFKFYFYPSSIPLKLVLPFFYINFHSVFHCTQLILLSTQLLSTISHN